GSVDDDRQDHVRPRTGRAAGVPAHASLERPGGKAEAVEGKPEQRVLLKTIAAAPPPDERVLQRSRIEIDRQSHLDVEVLERNGGKVRPMERVQRRHVGTGRLRLADAGEIRRQIEGGFGIRHIAPFEWRRTAYPAETVRWALSITFDAVR